LKGAPGRGTLEKEKPPILGLIERGGAVVIQRLATGQRVTIQPLIRHTIQPGTLVFTDEYAIYQPLEAWGYAHKTVNPAQAEYARDADQDGCCEVHVNPLEGCWSLLRAWLRPHRAISQEQLPLYLGFFEFVHTVRRRGKALLASLLSLLVAP
jgi:transposase